MLRAINSKNREMGSLRFMQTDMFTMYSPEIPCSDKDEEPSPQPRSMVVSALCIWIASIEIIMTIFLLVSR